MSAQHGVGVRGLEAAGQNPNFEGAKFGRIFKDLPAAKFGETEAEAFANLRKLADAMVSPFDLP